MSNSRMEPLSRRSLFWFALVQIGSMAGNLLVMPPSATTPFLWIPTALAFCWFVSAPRNQWLALSGLFLATHVVTQISMGSDPVFVTLAASASLFEVLLATWLIDRFVVPTRPPDIGKVLTAFALFALAALPPAAIGATWLWLSGHSEWSPVFLHWWEGDMCGSTLVALPFLCRDENFRAEFRRHPLRIPMLALLFAIVSGAIFAFATFPFPYLMLPFAIAAFHFGALRIAILCTSSFVGGVVLHHFWARFDTPDFSGRHQQALFLASVTTTFTAFLVGVLADQFRQQRTMAMANEQRLRDALTYSGTGFAVSGVDMKILEINPYMCHMLGYRQDELVGADLSMLTPQDEQGEGHERIRSILSGERTTYSIDRHLLRKDGTKVWSRVVVARPHSFADRLFFQIHDMTGDREATLALERAKSAAEEASRVKSEFVANMSHEIRTPLNGILGVAEILSRSELPDKQSAQVQMIRRSAKALSGIIQSVLDFSSLESGTMRPVEAPFDLDELVATLSGIMAVEPRREDLALAITVDPDVPRRLVGDALRLQQVLVNLVGNALKFTEKGEVHVRILRAPDSPERLFRFSVRDTGEGMDEAMSARIFRPFTQSDSSNTRIHGGTGLGLAISRRLVELLGGLLEFETRPGLGTEFRFSVPLREIDDAPIARTPRPPHPILVVESNVLVRSSLEKAFKRLDWDCQILSSVPSARDLIQRAWHSGESWTAVVADSGLAGFANLAQDAQDAQIPLISMDRPQHPDAPRKELFAASYRALLLPITEACLIATLEPLFDLRSNPGTAPFAPGGRSRRVLVVEDNPINQVVASGILDQLGFEHELAENGRQAVDILEASPDRFDLVLMDIQMPVMDGFEATRIIHRELGLTIPIVAMTASVLPRERERCFENGLDDFLAKPFDPTDLMAVLERNLKHSSSPG